MRHAFSLVELSIVLVILGLLAGGILTGQSLIRAAELRSIISKSESFKTAIYTFKDKYFYLPGDMPNANAFWGADCKANAPSSNLCNGNANGSIYSDEMRAGLAHLANAGLIEGYYDLGISAIDVYNEPWVVGKTIPLVAGDIGMIQGIYGNITTTESTSSTDLKSNGRVILISGNPTQSHAYLGMVYENSASHILTTQEAWNIDKKIDDGHGRGGKVIAGEYGTTGCTGANNAFPAPTYNLLTEDKACMLFIGY